MIKKADRIRACTTWGMALGLAIGAICLLPVRAVAENPFGSVDGSPPPPPPPPPPGNAATGFQPEDDDFNEQGGGFGFTPPPSPDNNGAPNGNAPTRLTTAPPATPPMTPPKSGAAPAGKSNAKAAPKLADYLELDPSVKGLEVKNFDLPDKDIKDVVTLISKWTGKNFILDSKVRGKITIIGPSQVTLQEAYQAFLSALDANGLTTVQSGKFIRIIESAEARRMPVKTYAGDYAPKDDQFITRIFQLKYINADEVQREFRDLTTRQGKLFAYEPTNSIIITDTGSNIERIKEILEVLDIKGFETTLHVLRIKNTSAKQISEMLGEIYGEKSQNGRPQTFRRSALERTRGGGVIAKIIPDEATNSLVVLANQAGFESLKILVAKLDVKVADTGRIHVYYCEYAKAEDLASTLASLAGGGGGKSSKKPSGPTPPTPGAPSSPISGGSSGPVSAELEGGVKVTSDAPTNALVITANSADYQTLKKVIRKLDIPRLQVFVETAILEIDVSNSNQIGVTAALGAPGIGFAGGFVGNGQDIASFLTGSVPPPNGGTIPILAGPTFNATATVNNQQINFPVRTFMGLLRLLTQNTNSSILSTPQIIALDNEKAEFKVLDKVPTQSSFTTANVVGTAGQIPGTGNIDYKDVGITLKLTPHINATSKNIRLEIEQKVDNINNSTSSGTPSSLASVAISTISRETNTQVVVHDQDFVMLGGLMSDKIDDSITKVPLLGDIPILGWLFKSKTHNVTKQNLVVLLRPRIIGTTVSMANLVGESLKARDKFIDKETSSDDDYAQEVQSLRAKLKDQASRGKNEPIYDYRNNEEEEEAKPRPGQESELNDERKSLRSREEAGASDGKGSPNENGALAGVNPPSATGVSAPPPAPPAGQGNE